MTMVSYDPDLPIHMKDGMLLLKTTTKSINEDNMTYEKLTEVVVELDREFTHGLNQIKNNGYVTEGMANGEPTPDWVPIKKEQAIKDALDFLKNDPFLSEKSQPKVDKRSKDSCTEEEWEQKKLTKKEKAQEKKRRLEEYDTLCEEVETYKEKARSYKEKYMKCKAYFISNSIDIPE